MYNAPVSEHAHGFLLMLLIQHYLFVDLIRPDAESVYITASQSPGR